MNDITIVGGGSSGWFTAVFLSYHNPDKQIILIEAPDISNIGVGEGTFPTTMHLLNSIGIKPSELIAKSNAGLKIGIQYVDFAEKPFWLTVQPINEWQQFGSELINSLALLNKCPILDDSINTFHAIHFIADDFINLLKTYAIKYGVKHLQNKVVDSSVHDDICSSITLDSGETIKSKWFVDCSGFLRLLIKQTSSKFISYSNELLVNSAVVGPADYVNIDREFNVFTKITAKQAGWQFRVPTYKRTGNGYVYSSNFITNSDAEKALVSSVKLTKDPKHIKMNLGYYDKLIVGNIVAVGLSAGFIEPLEATAIYIAERVAIGFNEILNGLKNTSSVNAILSDKIQYIKTLILAHYAFSPRSDPFWVAAREAASSSREIKEFFNRLNNNSYPTDADVLDVAYPYCQWNDLLRGFNKPHMYPTVTHEAKKQVYLATYYLPNHYNYITSIRSSNAG